MSIRITTQFFKKLPNVNHIELLQPGCKKDIRKIAVTSLHRIMRSENPKQTCSIGHGVDEVLAEAILYCYSYIFLYAFDYFLIKIFQRIQNNEI